MTDIARGLVMGPRRAHTIQYGIVPKTGRGVNNDNRRGGGHSRALAGAPWAPPQRLGAG